MERQLSAELLVKSLSQTPPLSRHRQRVLAVAAVVLPRLPPRPRPLPKLPLPLPNPPLLLHLPLPLSPRQQQRPLLPVP